MNLCITGSSGFIGTNFIKNGQEFNITEVNLLTHKVEDTDFSGFDCVLHLAALVHQMQGAHEADYMTVNRDLTVDVASKAKAQGVKHFVFMSSAKVFGESTTGRYAWDENSECNPTDPYGKSKLEAEKLLLGLEDEYFKVAVIRSPLVYGAGVKANMYNLVKLVNRFILLPLGGIHNCRSFVYAGNLVALLKHIINKQSSGIFIAGDRESLSTTRLIQIIAKASNRKIILITIPSLAMKLLHVLKPTIADRLFGSLELNNTTTNTKLNFYPPFTVEEGIGEMVSWYKNSCK